MSQPRDRQKSLTPSMTVHTPQTPLTFSSPTATTLRASVASQASNGLSLPLPPGAELVDSIDDSPSTARPFDLFAGGSSAGDGVGVGVAAAVLPKDSASLTFGNSNSNDHGLIHPAGATATATATATTTAPSIQVSALSAALDPASHNSQQIGASLPPDIAADLALLLPPKLKIKRSFPSSKKLLQTPSAGTSPMSAASKLQAATLAQLIATLSQANFLPPWFSALLATGSPTSIRNRLKLVYHAIRELEDQRFVHNAPDRERFRMTAAGARGNERYNRYSDILPFDYNRVRLNVPIASSGTDYINASHITTLLAGLPTAAALAAEAASRSATALPTTYIAAQGPMPSTIGAFWEMVWEQNSGVIVMLTPEEENGKIKCHRYWPDKVGSSIRYATSSSGGATCFKIQLSEETPLMNGETILREFIVKREIVADVLNTPPSSSLSSSTSASASTSSPATSTARPVSSSGSASVKVATATASSPSAGNGDSTHRRDRSSQPVRVSMLNAVPEIRRVRMLHFIAWPDHQISSPRSVLQLVDLFNELLQLAASDMIILDANGEQPAAPTRLGPPIIHCSAGCGRTGVFCTIDSVLKLLPELPGGSLDAVKATTSYVAGEWSRLPADDIIALTINHLRRQRIGSVQTLDQFIFCYDAVVTRLGDWFDAGRPPLWVPGSAAIATASNTAGAAITESGSSGHLNLKSSSSSIHIRQGTAAEVLRKRELDSPRMVSTSAPADATVAAAAAAAASAAILSPRPPNVPRDRDNNDDIIFDHDEDHDDDPVPPTPSMDKRQGRRFSWSLAGKPSDEPLPPS
eukprot:jgi/Hompol1/5190/HPOL_004210-RA